jgi:hypothetical protein
MSLYFARVLFPLRPWFDQKRRETHDYKHFRSQVR